MPNKSIREILFAVANGISPTPEQILIAGSLLENEGDIGFIVEEPANESKRKELSFINDLTIQIREPPTLDLATLDISIGGRKETLEALLNRVKPENIQQNKSIREMMTEWTNLVGNLPKTDAGLPYKTSVGLDIVPVKSMRFPVNESPIVDLDLVGNYPDFPVIKPIGFDLVPIIPWGIPHCTCGSTNIESTQDGITEHFKCLDCDRQWGVSYIHQKPLNLNTPTCCCGATDIETTKEGTVEIYRCKCGRVWKYDRSVVE